MDSADGSSTNGRIGGAGAPARTLTHQELPSVVPTKRGTQVHEAIQASGSSTHGPKKLKQESPRPQPSDLLKDLIDKVQEYEADAKGIWKTVVQQTTDNHALHKERDMFKQGNELHMQDAEKLELDVEHLKKENGSLKTKVDDVTAKVTAEHDNWSRAVSDRVRSRLVEDQLREQRAKPQSEIFELKEDAEEVDNLREQIKELEDKAKTAAATFAAYKKRVKAAVR
ncbi:hypothetical protein EK21DRAFT_87041 [Setomelanomma holmii]|uniref:Uncharacterized protein n=1 Tax=Setomelanomma holmii TaxID=210430 RepID=A0A9P4HDR6_9PLEO|nr:hypothetical protein EK21DRAFT_87041 [Setomelanomma holmii]